MPSKPEQEGQFKDQIEAFEIIAQMTPADYALLCEYGAREYIKYMSSKIAELDKELADPEISPDNKQAILQFRNVFEYDMKQIEHHLESIIYRTDTDRRRKIPLYYETGGEN